jgi:hypothetical protein
MWRIWSTLLLNAQCEAAIGEAFTICDADVPWREFWALAAIAASARSIPVFGVVWRIGC